MFVITASIFHFVLSQKTLVSVEGQTSFRKLKISSFLSVLVCVPLQYRSSWHLQPLWPREQHRVVWPRWKQTVSGHQQPVDAHGQRSAAVRGRLSAHPALWHLLHWWFCRTEQLPSLHRWMSCSGADRRNCFSAVLLNLLITVQL